MIFYDNLEEIIFHRHELFDVDELVILSGYVGPQPVKRLKELQFNVKVIYGMYGSDGIGRNLHAALTRIDKETDNVEIFYSELPVHAKIYIWKKNGKIVTALIGSANFSISGLSNPYKETLAETTFDTFSPLIGYINRILAYTKKCNEIILEPPKDKEDSIEEIDGESGICRMSLLNRNGEVSEKSGLNWGRARLDGGHTSKGDAYIAITKELIRRHPELFPPKLGKSLRTTEGAKINRQNDAVDLIWDDGTVMEGLLEGTQEENGVKYPKQLCSGPVKNVLGTYLRKRMGIEDLDYQITKSDLEKYGRTDIEIRLQGEGIYELNFSV
ncbi:MAG: NgoFVII family restriction endonuclease [Eubacterium sp.]|nr:NgoFVII family restriction endonuclease [Eubacterium sp.]